MLGAGALGRPRGMEWGGRREEGSGWGTHVYPWRIHFDIWHRDWFPCAGAVLSLAQTHRGRPQTTSTRLYAGGEHDRIGHKDQHDDQRLHEGCRGTNSPQKYPEGMDKFSYGQEDVCASGVKQDRD